MTRSHLREILREYRQGLSEALGDQLDAVLLYGSQARGDAREGSDIDVLCVLREPFRYGAMIEQTSELTSRLSLKYDVVLSPAFLTRDKFDNSRLPFVMNVRQEGKSL